MHLTTFGAAHYSQTAMQSNSQGKTLEQPCKGGGKFLERRGGKGCKNNTQQDHFPFSIIKRVSTRAGSLVKNGTYFTRIAQKAFGSHKDRWRIARGSHMDRTGFHTRIAGGSHAHRTCCGEQELPPCQHTSLLAAPSAQTQQPPHSTPYDEILLQSTFLSLHVSFGAHLCL